MKLLIADDHSLFRDTLVQYIERANPDADIEVKVDYYGVEEALTNNHTCDLILLDYKMPGMNGLEGFQALRRKFPDIRVALMSGIAEQNIIQQALDMGAAAYFPKTLSGKSLLQAIQRVLDGEIYIPKDERNPNLMMPTYYDDAEQILKYEGLEEQQSSFKKDVKDFKLTRRENEVLSYLVKGNSNKEIAKSLGLQEVTIKLHVRGICRKLGVKNRTQAALKAQELKIVKQVN